MMVSRDRFLLGLSAGLVALGACLDAFTGVSSEMAFAVIGVGAGAFGTGVLR